MLLIAPGDVVPVDGTLGGADGGTGYPAVLDESALTGEALPVSRGPGDTVRSGVLNAGRPFDLLATATAADSTYAGIVRLVAEGREPPRRPSSGSPTATRCGSSPLTLAVAAVAWLLGGALARGRGPRRGHPLPARPRRPGRPRLGPVRWRRGAAWSSKGGAVLERLARCTTLLLDKTGTLTSGRAGHSPAIVPAGEPCRRPRKSSRLAASLDQVSAARAGERRRPGRRPSGAAALAAAHRGRPRLPGQGITRPGRRATGSSVGKAAFAVGSAGHAAVGAKARAPPRPASTGR